MIIDPAGMWTLKHEVLLMNRELSGTACSNFLPTFTFLMKRAPVVSFCLHTSRCQMHLPSEQRFYLSDSCIPDASYHVGHNVLIVLMIANIFSNVFDKISNDNFYFSVLFLIEWKILFHYGLSYIENSTACFWKYFIYFITFIHIGKSNPAISLHTHFSEYYVLPSKYHMWA